MKIIKEGKKPEDLWHQPTCYNCKTVVEFQVFEGTITREQRDGDYVTVSCPICGYNINSALSNGK